MIKHPAVERSEAFMDAFLTDLQAIVNIDSGTYTKAGIDQVVTYLQGRFHSLGFTTEIEAAVEYGNHLIATRQGAAPDGPHLLVIGHTDTVYPEGDVALRPFTIQKRDDVHIATGPGVLDMKSGLLIGLYGFYLLNTTQEENFSKITFICNSDEEIGSPSSRELIQRLASKADCALVLEPGRELYAVVSARRGIGHYRVEVEGIAAHAGVEPHKGRSAILELARKIVALEAINGTIPGINLNVGIIHGGERTNIVPDKAYCEIDVRVSDRTGAELLEAAIRKVCSQISIDGTRISLSGGLRSLPVERSAANLRLFSLAKAAGAELGIEIQDVTSGGASDANTVAGQGIPILDGLGSTGSLAHNPNEYIVVDDLPLRIALFANLVHKIGNAYQNGEWS